MKSLPSTSGIVIIGAGFAGAAAAWALGRAGLGPGLILEQEFSFGVHASGRNAAIAKLAEHDAVIGALAARSAASLRAIEPQPESLVRRTGGVTLSGPGGTEELARQCRALHAHGIAAELLDRGGACGRFPWLAMVDFTTAVWCPEEGVVDIHALLGRFLELARDSGFALYANCRAEDLLIERDRVVGVQTERGAVRAPVVVDAGGAWAGRLGRDARPLGLRPLRRHLFVSGPAPAIPPDAPFVWLDDAALYFRPEGDGLLLSPCDESLAEPGLPQTDPAAAELLADKLEHHAARLADLEIRRSWACLRTFAADRRPVIGPDPELPGLFHVSALGGFGMTCSAAIGELAATLLSDRTPDWIDASAFAPARLGRST